MGICLYSLMGVEAKCRSGWAGWMDTPSTVMTTRAPAMYFQYIGGMKCMYV